MLRRKTFTKVALLFSSLLILLWMYIGTQATIAWFTDDDELVNGLFFGNLEVNLYHKTPEGYELVDESTKVFDDAALYEPGYTQVVYLKIENAGTIDFNYEMSIVPDMSSIVLGYNKFGAAIDLTDYLTFGFVFDETEEGLLKRTNDRDLAETFAVHPLSNYTEEAITLAPEAVNYCALILYMPKAVENEANYRGDTVPSVEVGISVVANQIME